MEHSFKTLSNEMIPLLEQEMRQVLQSNDSTSPQPFLGMMHYHMGWTDADLNPLKVKSGKLIRPLLCLISCEAAGGNWQQALPAAAAIEILHNFSLIHDDIEDASPIRRGRDTIWKIWGIAQAINSGDAMFAMAHLAMNRLIDRNVPAHIVVHALRRFDETNLHLTQGQHADIDFETRDEVTVSEYLEMITGKTAVLLSLCSELGALIAGADPDTITNYQQFGLKLGLAFQVIDDILGIWGDETLTGKSAATDILTKKKTLPVLYGLSQANTLQHLYTTAEADETFVKQVISELDKHGAYDFAKQHANNYSQSALSHLEYASPTGNAGDALYELANLLLKRNY
ncbi:MAG: polyprenyl synthetase family protein [Chloroflexi bacterium]|nr:polyprenyl synthetase family protein [Chloroflexota bacterium]